jgi:hypothetical protein
MPNNIAWKNTSFKPLPVVAKDVPIILPSLRVVTLMKLPARRRQPLGLLVWFEPRDRLVVLPARMHLNDQA